MKNNLISQLKRWGEATANRYQPVQSQNATQLHPLDRAMDFAPGTRANAAKLLAGRDGRSRRKIMGTRRVCSACERIAIPSQPCACGSIKAVTVSMPCPEWACDPIPCTETHKRTPRESVRDAIKNTGRVDVGVPADVEWIDFALAKLANHSAMMAVVLRVEYSEHGSRKRKLEIAGMEYDAMLKEAFAKTMPDAAARAKFLADHPPGSELSISKDQYKRALAKALAFVGGAGA